MATLIPNAKTQFCDASGRPLVGGFVYMYFVGTENFKDTYQNPGQTILNTNPIVLDGSGEAVIWGSGAYRQVVTDKFGVQIWDQVTQDANASLVGNMTDDTFIAGDGIVPNTFLPGTTAALTLSAAFGAVPNIWVFFDGIEQQPSQIASLVGFVLTFSAPIPVGVKEVLIKGGTTVALGTPGAGSVNDAALASGSQIWGLVNRHFRVRTDPNTNYDGVDQTTFPEANPFVYTADGESFAWSMRNSKHTAFEIYNSVNGATTQFYDGVQGVTQLAAGSNIGQATGVAGYIKNQCGVSGGHPNGVALFGLGTGEADNTNTWGVNTLLQDSSARAVGAGIGRLLIGYENDINVMNPATQVIGVSVGGNGLSQPAAANAFIANSLGTTGGGSNIEWGTAFWSTDGNAQRALVVGRNGPLVANSASQEVWFNYADFAGASQIAIMKVLPAGGSAPGGALSLGGSALMGFTLNDGVFNAVSGAYLVNSVQVVGAQVPGYGTPLNGTRQSGFNASTATLGQTAAMLAALMTDLKQHGLIGV